MGSIFVQCKMRSQMTNTYRPALCWVQFFWFSLRPRFLNSTVPVTLPPLAPAKSEYIYKRTKYINQMENFLPFVLNTKHPLSDIWLLSYEPNSFGCFFDKIKVLIFFKTPKNCFDFISATKYHQDPFSAPKLNI